MGPTRRVHPDWALKQKRPGTELRYIRGIYYLYGVSSKWNKEKKRAQKVTGKILGRVTENGFIESARRQILDGKSKVENAVAPTIKSISIKQHFFCKFQKICNQAPGLLNPISCSQCS